MDGDEYMLAREFGALPLGFDLWSYMFLTPDGEIIWAGWMPLEVNRWRSDFILGRALKIAGERYPLMAHNIPPPEK